MSDSEEEAPVQLSFKAAKSAAEDELHLVAEQKKNEARVAKLKRQMKQELFLTQKRDKIAKLSKPQKSLKKSKLSKLEELAETPESQDDDEIEEEALINATELPEPTKPPVTRSSQPKKKIYKDLNIQVTTFRELKNSRATSAMNFKEKRLAKPHRESVNMNLVHLEKLKASGKL